MTCTDAGTPPPTTSCTVAASQTLLGSSGGVVTITATNCGTISSWTGAVAVAPGTVASFTDTLPPNIGTANTTYTYTVTGSGSPTTASTTVTVSAPPPPTSTPTSTISCSGYATQLIDIPWGKVGSGSVRVTTKGFTNGMIVVGRFTTPNVVPSGTPQATVAAAESSSTTGPIARTAALSLTPCDFPSPNPIGGLWSTISGGTSPTVAYQVNGTSPYYAVLAPNTTYYFNIKNEVSGMPTCPAQFGSCDMYIEISKATGW
ncbi:MAG: hypothetical protein KGJ25_13070 [Betaproteobacteria bacterium]|nr:hypothetical protein [Betaproteobacteria bacterium]